VNRCALVTDYAWPSLDPERRILGEAGLEVVVAPSGAVDELVELAADAEAILTNWKKVPARVLEAAPRCVTVARYGVGIDNIDVDAATELGIVVTNVPDYCVDEVAEHALALALALGRRIVPFAEQTRSGGWDNQGGGPLRRLRGRTFGLVGFGRIARAVALRAQGLGFVVLTWSPRLDPGTHDGVEAVGSLGELLDRSDFVSLHAPLTEDTRQMIGRDQLARMRRGAYLINTARGALVDEEALREALLAGTIGGAGLDVMSEEPPSADHPLRRTPGVVMTPHAAFFSVESIEDLQAKTAANVVAIVGGRSVPTIVNPAVLDRPTLRAPLAGAGRSP
jgi:D-3-phosphoglycerate dehydrogenase / 2-oxoglutarate reductase